jgi:mono/diheme cytochrome c family protein
MKTGVFVLLCFFVATGVGPSPAVNAATMLERGAYLVNGIAGCGNCHTPRFGPKKGIELAGGFPFGGPKAPFQSYASNITPDRETGIGAWTDDQLIAAIREGKRPDGSVIGPPMAIDFYKYMSDGDAKAIVAYLRSVKPVRNNVPKSVYRIPLQAGKPVGQVADISPTDKIAYGKYQVRIGHCMECHTPFVKGHPDLKNLLGAGGRAFKGPWGKVVSANITPDKSTGIGNWTASQIKRAITKGVRHDGTKMRPPMCFGCYDNMNAVDIEAMVSYLLSIKPIRNDVR